MIDLVRFSGYRLKGLPPEQLAYRWAALRTEVEKYLPLLKQLPLNGFYLDDAEKQTLVIDALMGKLANGEVYFAFSKSQFIGLGAITDIAYGRNAYIEAITVPCVSRFAVGKGMGELLTYAFNDFPAGLGLKKLKATVAQPNMPVIKMLMKVGFVPAGLLRSEALHMGIPQDMMLLEYLNPKFFSVDKQVISNVKRTTSSELSDDPVHFGPGSGDSPECVGSDSAGDERAGDCSTSEPDDEHRPVLAEPEQLQWDDEPVSAGGTGRTIRPEANESDEQLVHAESGATGSGSSPKSDATGWAKLRKLWPGNGRTDDR